MFYYIVLTETDFKKFMNQYDISTQYTRETKISAYVMCFL